MAARKKHEGIRARHSRPCATRGETCTCDPSYEAWAWDNASQSKIRRTFAGKGALSAAKNWRADTTGAVRRGTMVAPSRTTFRKAAEEWLKLARSGAVTARKTRQPYKPSTLRGYQHDLETYVFPDFGAHKLGDIRRGDLQRLIERLNAKGCSGSKVRNIIVPVQVLYRRAVRAGDVAVNPAADLDLPEAAGRRDRAASPQEAVELLDALALDDQPLWATAFYAGLRRGELRGLTWDDVDLERNVIQVRRGWDDQQGAIEPKSKSGTRTVPIAAALRIYLLERRVKTGRSGDEFVFGSHPRRPFAPSHIRRCALAAWEAENVKRREQELDELQPIGLHECRHTYVSLMHAAGLSLEQIGDYIGHSSAYMTDRYRHLLDGHEADAAAKLDEFLAKATAAQ